MSRKGRNDEDFAVKTTFEKLGIVGAYAMLAMAQFTAPGTAFANPAVSLNSAIYVERATSNNARSLEPASSLNRGDRVVTVLTWYRMGGGGGFTVTNPLPRTISYQGSTRENEEISVDGGKNWGQLDQMRFGSRMATREDVTHVRWRIPADNAAQGVGRITYAGIVR